MSGRIKPIEETDAPVILKPLHIGFKRVAGKVSTSLKVAAHRPSIAWFGNLFGLAIEKSATVEKRIHFLVQLRAAQIVELTASVAFENYRARFNHALKIGSDNFYE